jgi:hypothetical protein
LSPELRLALLEVLGAAVAGVRDGVQAAAEDQPADDVWICQCPRCSARRAADIPCPVQRNDELDAALVHVLNILDLAWNELAPHSAFAPLPARAAKARVLLEGAKEHLRAMRP